MAFRAKEIGRLIINGTWYTVEPGSFQIDEFEIHDEDGNPMHPPLGYFSYRFRTDNRDVYTGPLSEIELYKLIDV